MCLWVTEAGGEDDLALFTPFFLGRAFSAALGNDCRLCWSWGRTKLRGINFIPNARGDCPEQMGRTFLAELLFRQLSSHLCPAVTLSSPWGR